MLKWISVILKQKSVCPDPEANKASVHEVIPVSMMQCYWDSENTIPSLEWDFVSPLKGLSPSILASIHFFGSWVDWKNCTFKCLAQKHAYQPGSAAQNHDIWIMECSVSVDFRNKLLAFNLPICTIILLHHPKFNDRKFYKISFSVISYVQC